MSEPRKNHLAIDGAQVKDDEHIASYKPLPDIESGVEMENEYVDADTDDDYVPTQEDMTQVEENDDEDHWTHDSIKTMLQYYLQNIQNYTTTKRKKKFLWMEVAQAVGKSPQTCDKKFRNLKQTYIRLVRKKNNEGVTEFKWPYFQLYDAIYCNNGVYNKDVQEKIDTIETDTRQLYRTSVAKTDLYENGEGSNVNVEVKKKAVNRRKFLELKKIAQEMRDRQHNVELKLDRLISTVEESNNIQRERNRLFVQFLQRMEHNSTN